MIAFNDPINRPQVLMDGTPERIIVHINCHCALSRPLYFIPLFSPSCSGLDNHRLFSPNIWCPPCSKLKDDPDNATKMNQPTSPSRRRHTPYLHPKPSTHLLRPSPPSPKALSTLPSVSFSKSGYTNQPTCPPLQWAPA
jgi:hypothetical protein